MRIFLKELGRPPNAFPLLVIQVEVLRASARLSILFVATMFAGQAWAFPMKPDVKLLLEQAQRPRPHYVPARAGWNGPEEKAADAVPNPTYEALRREPTPAEMRTALLAAAVPDWRLLLAIMSCIVVLRLTLRGKKQSQGTRILAFPNHRGTSEPELADAA